MLIDLHAHSTASDGTESPGEVMRSASAAGVGVLALTDHDTTSGWAEAADAVEATGVALVRGAEITSRQGHISVHLLSYLHDPHEPDLAGALARSRSARERRARAIGARLARDFPLTWEDVAAQVPPGATVGRPHLADALVSVGVVPDRDSAFASVLADGSPYVVPTDVPTASEVIRLVRAAGGVPVLAHPFAASRGACVSANAIAALAHAGLLGIEVRHRDHDAAATARLAHLADELGLLATGSSDYHGTGKLNRLAEHTTSAEVLAAIEGLGSLPVLRPRSGGDR